MIDPFGREINYLRVSVTDMCNQRCGYCMPPEGIPRLSHETILRFEEICEVVREAVGMGVRKIRVTGGEPLVRRGIVDLVAMLGFLSLFELRGKYEGRTINVHPALIPAFCGHGFYGQRVHEAVLASGVKVSGATVHFSDEEYDHGPIILQEAVPVMEGDSAETLAARVIAAERRLVPEAIRLIARGRVHIEENKTRIDRS